MSSNGGEPRPMLLNEPSHQFVGNHQVRMELGDYWDSSPGTTVSKLQNFPKYVLREDLTKFVARNELFKRQLQVHGSVVDLGVARGASLMTWMHLSTIYEPANYTRKIIGFDTFTGIPQVDPYDLGIQTSEEVRVGGFAVEDGMREDIERAVALHGLTRYLSHIPKVEIVEGDAELTLAKYLTANPYLVVSLLNIDTDLYRPARVALQLLFPRMPKGAVVIFDEMASHLFPGETVAVQETLGISSCRIERFDFAPALSYVVVE
jgi:Macrocin-O-methyltransferase (TylF)